MKSLMKRFTLIELLVILSIIATLVGLLIPALNRAMEKVETIQCQKNMEQVYQGFMLYASDNKGQVPHSYDSSSVTNWSSKVYTYFSGGNEPLNVHEIEALGLECPSADKSIDWQFTTYAMNAAVGGISWSWWEGWVDTYCNIYRAPDPSEVFMLGEKNPFTMYGSYAIYRFSFPVIDKQSPGDYNYNVGIRHDNGSLWTYIDGRVDWQDSDRIWSNKELGREIARSCY